MRWQTKVEVEPLKERINYNHSLLFLGSCFANEMGAAMERLQFDLMINPFGTLYNPASIVRALERLESGDPFREEELFVREGLYRSFLMGSQFSHPSKEQFLELNNRLLKRASQQFHKAHFIILTLGSSQLFREKRSGEVVVNCHKVEGSKFSEEQLSYQETLSLLSPFISKYEKKRWILTVSPVRHFKRGAHQNQVSKAKLLLAANQLSSQYPNVSYFPSYEIFMDELRDYRFYGADMLHPSKEAIEYIWHRFKLYAVDANIEEKMRLIDSLNKMESHRVLLPNSDNHSQLEEKIAQLRAKIERLK